jgi:hypothetical protein
MIALTPTVEMCTTVRPVSIARSCDIANCWTLSADLPNVALLVWTASRVAPRSTGSRTRLS